MFLRLGRVLGRSGNTAFEAALVAELARAAPNGKSDLPGDEAKSLLALAQELSEDVHVPSGVPPQFDETVASYDRALEGQYELLGRIQPTTPLSESAPEELHVYLVDEQRIEAFSNLALEHPAWAFPLATGPDNPLQSSACTVEGERILVGLGGTLRALDPSGRLVWTRDTGKLPIRQLESHAGLALAMVGHREPERVYAVDAVSGIPLWQHALEADARWGRPIFGSGKAVFFSQVFGRPMRARIVDLFRGTTVAEVEPKIIPDADMSTRAWFADEKLFLPQFAKPRSGRAPSGIFAFDLETGRPVWSRSLGENESFHAVVHHGGADYVITLTESPGASGGIYALDTEHGGLRTIVPLRVGEEPIGLIPRTRTELDVPYLFTLTETSSDRGVQIRAIHLPYQVRWTWSLPLSYRELYHDNSMPVPAVSAECVAIAFVTFNPHTRQRGDALLLFMDRETGRRLDTRLLDEGFSFANRLELTGLGDSLFVVGASNHARGLRMQILEKIR